jgi:hypothetical protein
VTYCTDNRSWYRPVLSLHCNLPQDPVP